MRPGTSLNTFLTQELGKSVKRLVDFKGVPRFDQSLQQISIFGQNPNGVSIFVKFRKQIVWIKKDTPFYICGCGNLFK